MPGWKSGAAHAIKLAKIFAPFGPESFWPRAWLRISIPIMRSWADWCAMRPAWPDMAA